MERKPLEQSKAINHLVWWYAFSPSTEKAEIGRSLAFSFNRSSVFQPAYRVRDYFKNTKQNLEWERWLSG